MTDTEIDLFSRFWSCYPRKIGKGAAQKAWDKIKPDELLFKRMFLAIDAQIRQRKFIEDANRKVINDRYKKFIPDWPHPSTWLNGQRWLDELPSVQEIREEIRDVSFCPECKGNGKNREEYPHLRNPEHLCSWHFSDKRYSAGVTGIDLLRKAYKKRILRLPDESLTAYLKRTLKTGQERMENAKQNREKSKLERFAIQSEGTLEPDSAARPDLVSITDYPDEDLRESQA